MLSYVSRSGNISPYLKAASQAVASQVNPALPPVVQPEKPVTDLKLEHHTHHSLAAKVPQSQTRIISGIAVPTQVRFAHTDIKFPDFTDYRRESTKDPHSSRRTSDDSRRGFSYLMVAGGGAAAVYGTKAMVSMFVSSMSASADVLEMAKIEVKLGDIPEGKNVAIKWRGKPLFVRHRTGKEIEQERNVDIASLRDPQHDHERVQRPEWLILIGVCTHLGCVPIANAGEFGGYYCPCHGSHYDASGRIRKGPAPLNLEVPEHVFVDENTLIVG